MPFSLSRLQRTILLVGLGGVILLLVILWTSGYLSDSNGIGGAALAAATAMAASRAQNKADLQHGAVDATQAWKDAQEASRTLKAIETQAEAATQDNAAQVDSMSDAAKIALGNNLLGPPGDA